MAKVVFSKEPKPASVKAGLKLTLQAEVLGNRNNKYTWQADLGAGWKKVGETKDLVIKKTKKAHTGNYRCLVSTKAGTGISRIVKVEVGGSKAKAPTKEILSTEEKGALEEILEDTGENASPETIEKVQEAITASMPESLKEQ